MKFFIALLLSLFTYQAQANNVCYNQQTTTTDFFYCDLGCTASLSDIVAKFPTMEEVWQVVGIRFGGPWTVFQTLGANWYSNWVIAAICTCVGVNDITVFVQQ